MLKHHFVKVAFRHEGYDSHFSTWALSVSNAMFQDLAVFSHGELKTWYLVDTRLERQPYESNLGILWTASSVRVCVQQESDSSYPVHSQSLYTATRVIFLSCGKIQDLATFTQGELKTWYLLDTRLGREPRESNLVSARQQAECIGWEPNSGHPVHSQSLYTAIRVPVPTIKSTQQMISTFNTAIIIPTISKQCVHIICTRVHIWKSNPHPTSLVCSEADHKPTGDDQKWV
jgi:hypothetical protein